MPPIQIKLDSKQLQLTVEGVNKLGDAAKQAVMDEIGYPPCYRDWEIC